ncbi:MAG: 3-deoxy-D-manno-octulosonic acid transferase [bacterium]
MKKILFAVYNILTLLLFPVFFIALIMLSLAKNKKSEGFFYKLFPFAFEPLRDSAFEGGIWIHAVSLGELRASVNFIELLQAEINKKIYLSITTKTGYDFAKNLYKNNKNILIFYFPYDFYFSVIYVLKFIKPILFISVETEIWPNLFNILSKKDIPIAVINARISDKSYKNYLYFSFFFKYIFEKIDLVLCVSEAYCRKFLSLGIKKENVHKTGNMKFDLNTALIAKGIEEKSRKLKEIFNCGKIIAAGSTHRGEESLILNAALELNELELNKNLKKGKIFLFIAPRHPERFDEVYDFLEKCGIERYKLSSIYASDCNIEDIEAFGAGESETAVILVDIIGELLTIYNICDAAFVGGSMINAGGHNVLEPLIFGKPVIFGRYIQNFLEIANEIIEIKAGKMANSPKELYDALVEYLYNEKAIETASKSGLALISQNKGVSKQNLNYLMRYIITGSSDSKSLNWI